MGRFFSSEQKYLPYIPVLITIQYRLQFFDHGLEAITEGHKTWGKGIERGTVLDEHTGV